MTRHIKKIHALQQVFAKLKFPPNTSDGLTNPSARMEIPADFPQAISPYSAHEALGVIERELEKRGTTLEAASRINIAYPHKHPGLYPTHHNSAEVRAYAFQDRMRKIAPHVDWIVAEALVERLRLGRSENQTSFYALTCKQEFDIYLQGQKDPFYFADKNRGREFFVIVDNTIEQGTTIISMMSYIHHNGGDVLMVQGDRHVDIAQKRVVANDNATSQLCPEFNDVTRNCARLHELATAFSRSAGRQGQVISAQDALQQFNDALLPHGNSVFSITDGEAAHLLKGLDTGKEQFTDLVDRLQRTAKKPVLSPSSLWSRKS
ncbi:MAG: hypothetical protein IT560_12150 [Alphaproteobacteria bacterium]|nr:hypothetical protein [Alphaproteobacteria bacterium]